MQNQRGVISTIGQGVGALVGGPGLGGAIGGGIGGFLDQILSDKNLDSSLDAQLGILTNQKAELGRFQALKKGRRFKEFKVGEANNIAAQSHSGIDLESDVFKNLRTEYQADFAANEALELANDKFQMSNIDAAIQGVEAQRPGKYSKPTAAIEGFNTGYGFGKG